MAEGVSGVGDLKEDETCQSTYSPFDSLRGSEALTHVLSFCDFPSALRFSRTTCKSLRQDLYDHSDRNFLWKEIFHRHRFSLPTTTTMPNNDVGADYIRETQKRRRLAKNLLVPRNKKKTRKSIQCFDLPDRCFSFVPITPDGLLADWDDPPPVDFGCDSFLLLSPACGGDMVSLDPFHGTLSVQESCLDNAVASDEGMMEQAMLEAANLIVNNSDRQNLFSDQDLTDEDIAGAVFDQSVYRNHNISQYKKPPFQILFRLEDDVDLDACFPRDEAGRNRIGRPPAEIDVGYHGIDSKCLIENGQVVGCMVAVGRMFTKESRGGLDGRQRCEQVCTELHMRTRRNSNPEMAERSPRNRTFGSHKICRFPCSFQTIDICSTHGRVFVSFEASRGSMTSRNPIDGVASGYRASTIVVYQMQPRTSSADTAQQKKKAKSSGGTKYSEPEFLIHCQSEVSSLAVDPTGDTLLVGTASGSCEVWSISSGHTASPIAKRSAIINIRSSISRTGNNEENSSENDVVVQDSSDSEIVERRMRSILLSILKTPKIVSFHHPNYLPFSACGFVTLQHSSTDGSSLLLWRKDEASERDDSFSIVSVINLPLSGVTRAPRVFYDGRRILIYGQDHIGLIVLVYHVLASNEDIDLFQEKTNEETSGGVYNLTQPPRCRFANRIRHAALGGLQYYDSIHMTANDRFIVLNTKSGNLLSDSTSPYAEGLLVIDLQQA